ncbi:glycosyltransferase [bacterium]|nr:MAG: glycosyltransferase [bacterium]
MEAEVIDVCVCTYRRSSLSATLASIARQQLPEGVSIRVVVADNDCSPARRDAILANAQELGLTLTYVHAPARNISIARNACLDAAHSEWIAFIDDDEEAQPDWVDALLRARSGVEIVFGISQARYSEAHCAEWLVLGDFHSNRVQGNDPTWNGYTANVLINRAWVARHEVRFMHELGQIGGEDTMFFYRCHELGGRFGYAPMAIVFEDTPAKRASLGWLVRRRYRSGQIHSMILSQRGKGRAFSFATGLAKSTYCFLGAAAQFMSPVRRTELFLRGAMHVGVVAGALGLSPYREYGDQQIG